MAHNTVGSMPEFTQDSPGEQVQEEVKQAPVEETEETEKETPEPPAEKPLDTPQEEVQVDTTEPPQPSSTEVENSLAGLQAERVKLLKEISELKGQRREIKQEKLIKVEKELDDLKDLHPEDVTVIDRVLRAKGFVTKDEAVGMYQESVKQSELNKFLDTYPEYKPENDPNDVNWTLLQRELSYFKMPSDPHLVREVLERAHRSVVKVPSGHGPAVQKRQIEVASVGSGGAQRPSSPDKTLDSDKRFMLKQGGFTDEDISRIESRL